jgi:hypothetical protein
MADPNNGQLISTAFENVVTNKPIDQFFSEFWLLKYLTEKNGGLKYIDGGRNIVVSVGYAVNPNFRSITQNETVDTSRVDFIDEAEYDWTIHAGSVVYDEMELFKASGTSAKLDLLAAKIENAIASHKEDLSDSLVAATSGNNVSGLQTLIPATATSGSPGNISKSTYSWWRSQSATGTKTSTDFDNLRARMRTTFNACSKGFGGNHPKVIVSNVTPFEGYESLLTANERFTDKSSGDAGFKNGTVKFKGVDYGYDDRVQSASQYMLNPDGIKLAVGKGHWMKMGKEIESINQFTKVKKFHSFLQLILTEPRLLGVIHTIS